MRHFDALRFASLFLLANGHVDGTGKADANETAVFGRQLEVAIAQTFDVLYTQNKVRTLIPFNTSVDPGAEVVSYKQFDVAGDAEFIDDYADDFPSVEIKGAEFFTRFKGIGASYGYSLQDWRAAKLSGLPLDAKKAAAAREAIERKIEKVACLGDSARNMTGFANAANVPIFTQGTTSGLSGTITAGKVWLPTGGGTTASAENIFDDLALVFKSIFDLTKTVFEADTVVFPTKIYSYLNSKLFSPTYSPKTLMQVLRESNPWIKYVDVWARLDTAGADGKGRIVIFKRDPKVLEFMLSQDFESMPPETKAMNFTINCHARIGGVQVRYPKAMAYLDGCGGTDS